MMMVTTYPEDDSRALKVYQHQHHGCAGRPLGACRQSWGYNYLATASADSAGTFTVPQRAARSVGCATVKVAGDGTPVHTRSLCFPLREKFVRGVRGF